MALVQKCKRCGKERVIDVHCSDQGHICYECFANCDDLQHKPDCHVSIQNTIAKNNAIAGLYNILGEKLDDFFKLETEIEALIYTLRHINPCPNCQGNVSKINNCKDCNGWGFNHIINHENLPTMEQINDVY